VVEVGRALVMRWLPGQQEGRQRGQDVRNRGRQGDSVAGAACGQLPEVAEGGGQQQPQEREDPKCAAAVAEAATELLQDLQGWYPQLGLQQAGELHTSSSPATSNHPACPPRDSSSSGSKGSSNVDAAVAEGQHTSATIATAPCPVKLPPPTSLSTPGAVAAGIDTSTRHAVDQHSAKRPRAPSSATAHCTSTHAKIPAVSSTSGATEAASTSSASPSHSSTYAMPFADGTGSGGTMPSGSASTGCGQSSAADSAAGAAGAGGKQRLCGQCGAEGAAMRCGGCEAARYCNPACQKAHWKVHRRQCRELQRQRAGSSDGAPAGTTATAAAVAGADGT
jgi:hypothetical protein